MLPLLFFSIVSAPESVTQRAQNLLFSTKLNMLKHFFFCSGQEKQTAKEKLRALGYQRVLNGSVVLETETKLK